MRAHSHATTVAHDRLGRLQRLQPRQPNALHAATHGGDAAALIARNSPQRPAPPSQLFEPPALARRRRCRARMRPRRTIEQAGLAFGLEALDPFVCGAPADSGSQAGFLYRPALVEHAFNKKGSTFWRQSCMLMAVHPCLRFESWLCGNSSFSNPGRVADEGHSLNKMSHGVFLSLDDDREAAGEAGGLIRGGCGCVEDSPSNAASPRKLWSTFIRSRDHERASLGASSSNDNWCGRSSALDSMNSFATDVMTSSIVSGSSRPEIDRKMPRSSA